MARKYAIQFSSENQWVVDFYEKKAEIRNQLEKSLPPDKALLREMRIALEQYAIQAIQSKPDFTKLNQG